MPRRRCRGSRGRAPPELRLAYGARARPLGRGILSLLPPPPQPDSACPACRGAASGCLACRRWDHLLRDGDPVAYRRLVTRAVCAVAPDGAAPPPPRYTPGNAGHSQAKLVRETIKWIMADRSCTTKNVLCNGCREDRQSKRVISTGHRRSGSMGLYVLDTLHLSTSVSSVTSATATSVPSFAQWHHRLGHLCGCLSTLA